MTDDPVELTVEGMAFGGKGVARREGKVYFVMDTVPGDEILALVTKDEARYAEAELVELKKASPLRGPSQCSVAHECGGCQWMGVPYASQLEWKRSFVQSALSRIGKLKEGVTVAMRPAPDLYAYRNRILLRFHWDPAIGQRAGYFKRRTRELVPITHCPIAAPVVNRVVAAIDSLDLSAVPAFKARIEIQEIPAGQVACVVFPAEGLDKGSKLLVERLRALPEVSWAGLVFDLREAPILAFDSQLGVDFKTRPGQFQQINMAMNRVLRELVHERVVARDPQRILDVCCGSGNLSLPLADGKRYVEGVEMNKQAIDVAKDTAAAQGRQNTLYIAGDAERHLWKCDRAGEKFDLVILDPPRTGMFKGMVPLRNIGPQHILYVSCDPTTLARDLGYLTRNDTYEVDEVIAFDFFPNTYHVETLAVLRKR